MNRATNRTRVYRPVFPARAGMNRSPRLTRRSSACSPTRGDAPDGRAQYRVAGHVFPARAGNTCSWPRSCALPPVHPRACGEHRAMIFASASVSGPSPRVRGTRVYRPALQFDARSIPARAGNTPRVVNGRRHVTVHPRACGEHERLFDELGAPAGPSPRVRGTRERNQPAHGLTRSIPARAGNTLT